MVVKPSGIGGCRTPRWCESTIRPVLDAQPCPVLLVIHTSDGEIRWMEVRDWLRKATDGGKKQVRQIVFEGQRFDVMNVRRWRDRAPRRTWWSARKKQKPTVHIIIHHHSTRR